MTAALYISVSYNDDDDDGGGDDDDNNNNYNNNDDVIIPVGVSVGVSVSLVSVLVPNPIVGYEVGVLVG